MSQTPEVSTERLREVLLELEESEQRERQLRTQSDALLAGLRAFGEATSPNDLLHRVMETLREPLGFEDAFVLREVPSDRSFVATITTHARFSRSTWKLGASLSRTIAYGRVAIHFDTSVIDDWKEQPAAVREGVASALVMPLRGSTENALLVCVHSCEKAFQIGHKEMASKFQPLVTQALRDAERDAQIEATNRDMRLLLDSVDQGFMTIDRDAKVVGESSAIVAEWFGEVTAGTPFYDVLGSRDETLRTRFELSWEQLLTDVLPMEVSLSLMPSRLIVGEKTYSLRLRPIGPLEIWTRMLVVVSDISAALRQEVVELRMREFARVVAHIARDRRGFDAFRADAGAIIESLSLGTIVEKKAQYRALHTLKGNAAIVGLGSVSAMAHKLESALSEEGALPAKAFDALVTRWREVEAEVAPILTNDEGQVSISSTEYYWLLRELRDIGAADSELLSRVERFRLPAVSESLSSLADSARRVATTLGKTDIDVVIEDDGLRLDSERWRPFFSNAIHVVRNAIDHGIEAAEERVSSGKVGAGTLVLRQTRSDADVIFEISDDGRGIDWPAIANRAKEMGMAHETEEDLCDAVFADGLSTRAHATETSGRGVGVGAFRRIVEGLTGRVEVESLSGRGTCIRAVFPASTIASLR